MTSRRRAAAAALSGTVAAVLTLGASGAAGPAAFGRLLDRYVTPEGLVHYAAWAGDAEDRAALSRHVDALERTLTHSLAPEGALGTWIDLYNAATLELVLSHFPLASIREIGGPGGSPWRRPVVAVGGDSLSLDAIEHEIVRPRFADARVHFALNCAALGCPPLARTPYAGEGAGERLDAAARRAVNDRRFVAVEDDTLRLSRIFQWYEADFVDDAGSVRAFIGAFREGGVPPADLDRAYRPYDWALNRAP